MHGGPSSGYKKFHFGYIRCFPLHGKNFTSRNSYSFTDPTHYITDACSLFRLRKVPYKNERITDYIDIMLKTAKRYEEVPNRRYMITDEMRLHLSRRA